MTSTTLSPELRCAADPQIDAVARAILRQGVQQLAGDPDVQALLLSGSLAYGNACGVVVGGQPWLLSDVDFVVVPTRTARASLRLDLAQLSADFSVRARPLGLAAHAEFGLLTQRTLAQPPDRMFLHDLARRGTTLAGDEAPLRELRAALEARRPPAGEGRDLACNRLAGLLWMLDQVGASDAIRRLVLRYQFCKVYADAILAVETAAAHADCRDARAVLQRQRPAAARWHAWRAAPEPDPGAPAQLLAEWRSCLSDQVELAGALDEPPPQSPRALLRNAMAWARLPGPTVGLAARLGLAGSPLAVAHAACLVLADEYLAGPLADWIGRAREAVGLWRTALNGHDDTSPRWEQDVLQLLKEHA